MLQTWTFGGSLNACTVESAINNAINDVKFITLILGYWNLSCTKLLYWLLLEWSVFILALENTKMALYARNASYSRPRVTHVSCWKIVEIFRQDNWKIVEFINFAWGLTFHFELDHYVLHKIPLQKSSALKCQMKCWSRIKRVNLHFSETFSLLIIWLHPVNIPGIRLLSLWHCEIILLTFKYHIWIVLATGKSFRHLTFVFLVSRMFQLKYFILN